MHCNQICLSRIQQLFQLVLACLSLLQLFWYRCFSSGVMELLSFLVIFTFMCFSDWETPSKLPLGWLSSFPNSCFIWPRMVSCLPIDVIPMSLRHALSIIASALPEISASWNSLDSSSYSGWTLRSHEATCAGPHSASAVKEESVIQTSIADPKRLNLQHLYHSKLKKLKLIFFELHKSK